MLHWPLKGTSGHDYEHHDRLTFADFERLPEKEGVRYELDEGTLLLESSPALNHNLIRQRLASHLTQFVRSHN